VVATASRASRAAGSPSPRSRWNLLGPWAAILLTVLAFTVGRSHPLVQYNDDATRGWWHAWSWAWPILLLGTACGALLGVAMMGRTWNRGGPALAARAAAWAVTAAANAASLWAVIANFPDV